MDDLEANRSFNAPYNLPQYSQARGQGSTTARPETTFLSEADAEDESARLEEEYQDNISRLLQSLTATKTASQSISRELTSQMDLFDEADQEIDTAQHRLAQNTNSLHAIDNSPGSDWRLMAIIIGLIFVLVVLLVS